MKFDPAKMEFLRGMTAATVEASRVRAGERAAGSPANATGQTLVRPGGRAAYPAYWVRDFAMSMEAGFFTDDEIRHALAMTARSQNRDQERRLRNGAAIIPAWAVVDHMNFDGGAVYFPGTYSAGEDQGGEPFGVLPPACDHYYFAEIAHHLWKRTGSADFLKQGEWMPLIDRLHRAFAAVEVDEKTGLVATTPARRAVGFGFYDSVYITGSLLFPSLLRYRAAGMLAALCGALDDEVRAAEYFKAATLIRRNLPVVFTDVHADGWLIASTETGRQPDVWGTIYAIYLGVLPDEVAKGTRETLAAAVMKGTVSLQGGVRHIPTDHDHSPESAWQQTCGVPRGSYQNGAYWHTATGWLIAVLAPSHPDLAGRLFTEYVDALREDDFRRGPEHGAPWECFGPKGTARQNPAYMASVAVPYAILRDMVAKG